MGLEETLSVVVRLADSLRERGVLEIECEGVRLKLAPSAPVAVTVTDDADAEAQLDPADDGDTFGGQVPTRRGAPMKEQDDE